MIAMSSVLAIPSITILTLAFGCALTVARVTASLHHLMLVSKPCGIIHYYLLTNPLKM